MSKHNKHHHTIGDEYEGNTQVKAAMGTTVVFMLVAIAALVMGSLAFAVANNALSSADKVEVFGGKNLTFTGLGAGAFNVPATIVKQSWFETLRIFAANATCVANSSVATADASVMLASRLPLVDQSGTIMIYSGGARINGYLTLTAAGVLTIGGYGLDFKVGVCGWANDIVLNYVISAT